MSRRLASLAAILVLVLVSGCGPVTIVLPGGAGPTATTTATPTTPTAQATTVPPTATVPPATSTATATAAPTTAPATATAAPPAPTPTSAPIKPIATLAVPPKLPLVMPDLIISDMVLDPASPRMGDPVSVRVTVYNEGTAAAGAFKVEWWAASLAKGCDWDLTSLAAKGGRVLTCTYTYGGWSTYTVRAIADAGGAITESDEGNNTRSLEVSVKPVLVAPKPNLIITDLKVTPASPVQGTPATFSATVYNDGTAPAAASQIEIWAASASKACTKAVPSLPAKGGQVITCAYTYGGWSNAYAVKAIADSGADVAESNESDNTRQITISVKPAS